MRIVDGDYRCHDLYPQFKEDYLNPNFTRPQLIRKYDLRIGEYKNLVRKVIRETNYDKRGKYSKNQKLWNPSKLYHNSKNQSSNKPSKSFYLKYGGKVVNLGIGFIEPISCEIIHDLIVEFG